MGRIRKYKYYVADFETTVYEGQDITEVWASAIVEMYTENVCVLHSIEDTLSYLKAKNTNCIVYFHNLKFDGSFWLYFLISKLKLKPAIQRIGPREMDICWKEPKNMENNTFSYMISDRGVWYTIRIKYNGFIIEIRDSLKLLPFSVKKIGKDFKTKHKKLEMEYKGFRYPGCEITKDEEKYISNDVLVVKEALEIMFDLGHDKLTIGACCLSEYKSIIGSKTYKALFPNLYEVPLSEGFDDTGFKNIGDYIHKSYKGAWCYVNKEKRGRLIRNGLTIDVNSLYPSVMSSESGNKYPVGLPSFWKGNYIPDEAKEENKYYFVRIKTRFYLKKGYLPFIQIKETYLYKGNECLESSDVVDRKTGHRSAYYKGIDGEIHDTRVELTLTWNDFELIKQHYDLVDFEILDGCYFNAFIGLFDEYIEKYKKIKMESEGAVRTIAKLFLNNLYGKMAGNTDSSFKFAYIKEDGALGYIPVEEHDKTPGYIPVGSAITSYARYFTITAAQKNYKPGGRGFIYADTDSLHCDIKPEEVEGVKLHNTNFCCWKIESEWDTAIFARQKTYIEHVIKEDGEVIENPYYNIKCAGMPDKCKELLTMSIEGYEPQNDKDREKRTAEELEFLSQKREITDFKVGLRVPGSLHPKNIKGGILLVEQCYEMR